MKLYVIPAYGDNGKENYYLDILNQAKKKYEIKILNLQIKKGKLLSELVNDAIKIIKEDGDASIFGFSMGALISYCILTKIPLKKAILCSISPYLDKDILTLGPKFEKHLGKKLTLDVKKIKYLPIKTGSISILYGEKEHPLLLKRSKYIFKKSKSKHKKLVSIKNTGHEMNYEYTNAIKKEL